MSDENLSPIEREQERRALAGDTTPAEVHPDAHPWKDDVHELRRLITVGFANLPEGYDSDATLYPDRHPDPRHRNPEVTDLYQLHSYVTEFVSYLAPMADEVPELWEEQIATQSVPKPECRIEGVKTTPVGDYRSDPLARLEWGDWPITLASVPRWRGGWPITVTINVHRKREGGWIDEEKTLEARLSVDSLTEVVAQADLVTKKIGWLPETSQDRPKGMY